jgi:hypothetical protein
MKEPPEELKEIMELIIGNRSELADPVADRSNEGT